MHVRDLTKLLNLIAGVVLQQLVVFTDVTLTILRQSDDGSGFPQSIRRLIRRLLDRGAALVFVSGDSRVVLKEQLTNHLDCGPASVYVASGSGADIFVDEPHEGGRRHRTLCQLPPVPNRTLTAMLDQGLAALRRVLGYSILLSADERVRLLSPNGDRIDIADRVPEIHEAVLLECRPTKGFTLFLRQSERAGGLGLQLLNALAEDQQLRQTCSAAGLWECQGPNFYDAALSTKYRACELFLQTPEGRQLEQRRRIVASDSLNDASMNRYFASADAIRVFVGAPEEFEMVTGGGPNAVFLGGNLDGAALLFEKLLCLPEGPH